MLRAQSQDLDLALGNCVPFQRDRNALMLTAVAACVDPGRIGSTKECVTFCEGDKASFGAGTCQCIGSDGQQTGLKTPLDECTCPGGVKCLDEGSTATTNVVT